MILFTSDLMFGSKILGAAKHAGLRGQGIRSRGALATHAPSASMYFLDLEAELAEDDSALSLLDAALGHPHLRVVAFAGHMQVDALRGARERLATTSGAHEVHTRGSLNARLSQLVPPVATAPTSTAPTAPIAPSASGVRTDG